MNASDLKPGVYRVRIPAIGKLAAVSFNLSVIDDLGGIKGVAGFTGSARPASGKHLMLSPSVRNWITELEVEP